MTDFPLGSIVVPEESLKKIQKENRQLKEANRNLTRQVNFLTKELEKSKKLEPLIWGPDW